ncbi:MAG: DMT family transporter [Verrucomicrobiota bacterium]|nr:DMT family transporter [Verrucomicrobiota bacterium]
MDHRSRHARAVQVLALATIFWGLSFPTMKALGLIQQQLLPDNSTWFGTALMVTIRFTAAALIIGLWMGLKLNRITRLEVWQGIGLGVFGGVGLLFQMDGLNYTEASTSAFLTQSYCIFLPTIAAIRQKKLPSIGVLIATGMMIVGIAILTGFDWRRFHLGRGELETLVGSVIFTGQILWLARPVFSDNNVNHFSFVMFSTIALISAPLTLVMMRSPSDLKIAFASVHILWLTLILVLFCTIIAYLLMNRWQPGVSPTEAGLIYGLEPLFASLFALFLPAFYSSIAGISYTNELFTRSLVLGGGLILLANVIVQLYPGQSDKP